MDEMLYFAYGSNLLRSQMQARCPGARVHSVVRLEGYELCFPMISFTRSGMGVASIRPNEDAYVEGVIYEMTADDFRRLDHYESEGTKYRRDKITIPKLGEVLDLFSPPRRRTPLPALERIPQCRDPRSYRTRTFRRVHRHLTRLLGQRTGVIQWLNKL